MDASTPTIATTPEPVVGDAPARSWVRSWPVLIALFWLPGILWALASPLFSAPDEPSHVVKAVAVWHGQLSGSDETSATGHLTTTFQLPAIWAQARPYPHCFQFQPNIPADCAPPFAGSASITDVTTTAGHYPPAFYALVGWGGRLSEGPNGVYLMRLTSALACAVLLAAATRCLARLVGTRLALAGVLVAVTPIVAFLAGSVNPNGLEIAAAVAVWSALLAIARWPRCHDGSPPRELLVVLVVAGATLALTRTLSPAFLAAIAVLVALWVPTADLRALLRDRSVLVAGGAVIGIAALATVAIVASGALGSTPGRIGVDQHNPARVILGETDVYLTEMIGVFGWLDTRAPMLTLVIWLALVFGLVALAVAFGSRRSIVALTAVVAATLLIPVVIQYPSAVAQGLPWQGRYTLPVAVGIPLLAVAIVGTGALASRLAPRLSVTVAVLTGLGSFAAFAWALRRYATGAGGSLRFWSSPWQPPGGIVVLLAGMALAAIAAVVLVVLATDGEPIAAAAAPRARLDREGRG